MRVELFWAAWGPICDFRRRLHVRVQRQQRLAAIEDRRRAALATALWTWMTPLHASHALVQHPRASVFLWWPLTHAPAELLPPLSLQDATPLMFRSEFRVTLPMFLDDAAEESTGAP